MQTNLYSPLESIMRIDKTHQEALNKLGLKTIKDILYYFPSRYGDSAKAIYIKDLIDKNLNDKMPATIFGTISNLKTKKSFRGKVPMAEAKITDETGSIKVVWFNQPYLAKMLKDGSLVRADGIVSIKETSKGISINMANPKIEQVSKVPNIIGESLFGDSGDEHRLYPVYPETKGITSEWIFYAVQKILKNIPKEKIDEHDPIPSEILSKYNLPILSSALVFIHSPKKESDALSARKRFAFEEIFIIQIKKALQKKELKNSKTFAIKSNSPEVRKKLKDFIGRFPFSLTEAQENAIQQSLNDISKREPMARLLEGDVGSGKTAVSAVLTYLSSTTRPDSKYDFGNIQTAYMAPTEILARQQFESFIKYFEGSGMQIGLITSSGARKFPSKVSPDKATDISKTQLLKWVSNGEIAVLVGTHSLIQKSVKFKNLGFVVIDEQHRFGTAQRQKLARKDGLTPHLLSMTATPIPRTLALTIYGDLDISVLDQMPSGRKPIITDIIFPKDRDNVYEFIRKELGAGRQAYIICPRINEPDPNKEKTVNAKSAVSEAKRLKEKVFPEFNIGVMHGKLTSKDKEKTMIDFESGNLDILVSTSVVEVGVNVPNASIMIIEGAERFGLAQLHQLRGRIGRGKDQSYCYIFTESNTKQTVERLHAMKTAKDGFALAEMDLQLRGAGQLGGGKQWGISDLAMEALKNIKMVEFAREEAQQIIEQDLEMPKSLKVAIREMKEVHFE